MPLTAAERASMIERYAKGPALLAAALAKVPRDALQWKPGPKRWSAHEIIVHCADSETNAHMRLRYLLAEPDPLIVVIEALRLPRTSDRRGAGHRNGRAGEYRAAAAARDRAGLASRGPAQDRKSVV